MQYIKRLIVFVPILITFILIVVLWTFKLDNSGLGEDVFKINYNLKNWAE